MISYIHFYLHFRFQMEYRPDCEIHSVGLNVRTGASDIGESRVGNYGNSASFGASNGVTSSVQMANQLTPTLLLALLASFWHRSSLLYFCCLFVVFENQALR